MYFEHGLGTSADVEPKVGKRNRKRVVWRGREITVELEELLETVALGEKLGVPAEQTKATIDGIKALYANTRSLRNSEKTAAVKAAAAAVVAQAEQAASDRAACPDRSAPKPPYRKGRRPADAYTGAENRDLPHPTLMHGDSCPCNCGGRVYNQKKPKLDFRFRGGAPVRVRIYRRQKLRCNFCGKGSKAKLPKRAGKRRYAADVVAITAYLRYGQGFPLNRLACLQGYLGIPIAIATQFALALEGAFKLMPVYLELFQQGADAKKVGTDDTKGRILHYNRPEELADRTGIHTTGTVAETPDGHHVAIFFTGPQHAGENLDDLLGYRQSQLGPLQVMCDALSRNSPKKSLSEGVKLLLANCLAHGRRKFVEIAASFPVECFHVLEELGTVYLHDKQARQQEMNPAARLAYHQIRSQPIMDRLRDWMQGQLDEAKVEPNSRLGQAFSYMLTRWEKLTLFLREPGASLDNNAVERALKIVVRHRKNSLFYKTERGAIVGDVYMTLIQTCELNDINPVDYITALLKNGRRVAATPADWLPWTYRATLQRLRDGPRKQALAKAA